MRGRAGQCQRADCRSGGRACCGAVDPCAACMRPSAPSHRAARACVRPKPGPAPRAGPGPQTQQRAHPVLRSGPAGLCLGGMTASMRAHARAAVRPADARARGAGAEPASHDRDERLVGGRLRYCRDQRHLSQSARPPKCAQRPYGPPPYVCVRASAAAALETRRLPSRHHGAESQPKPRSGPARPATSLGLHRLHAIPAIRRPSSIPAATRQPRPHPIRPSSSSSSPSSSSTQPPLPTAEQ